MWYFYIGVGVAMMCAVRPNPSEIGNPMWAETIFFCWRIIVWPLVVIEIMYEN